MHHNTLNIFKVFFDLGFYLMSNNVSCTNGYLTINQEMKLDNAVKSALSNNTDVDIFDVWIILYCLVKVSLHRWITRLIEELTHRRPSDMIDIVHHEEARNDCCIVDCLCKMSSSKK